MGFSVSTADTFDYTLIADRNLPEGERPKLVCRFLSARQYREVKALKSQMHKALTDDEFFDLAFKVLGRMVVGWVNVKDEQGQAIPFDLNSIDTLLSVDDLIEIAGGLLEEMRLSEHEKKVAALRSQSITANSAESTALANA